ncbi:MAG: lipopolysaccharide transport periplasmic protein LptA [Psychrosphaera sp.]|nr:lipopolysaccharide transport periplasmic protein LptA [Psychrosphaera sp.]
MPKPFTKLPNSPERYSLEPNKSSPEPNKSNRKPIAAKGVLFSAALLLATGPALATKEDLDQPIEIDSVNQRIDLKNNISIFEKKVSITQGSLSIKAELLKVHRSNQQGSELFIATGNPATYSQTLDDGKVISAQANNIRYDVKTRSLVISGDAVLRQNDSVVTGKTIRYSLDKQELFAEGTDGKPTSTILYPKKTPNTSQKQEQKKDQEQPQL